jgi:carotenoid cleavage dioxygenase-like enzyme
MTTPANNLGPIDFETTLGPLPLTGALPTGLHGTLVRNGPNPVHPNPQAHWFAGDGMLHAFSIAGGAVHYRNRWVRTQRWQAAMEGNAHASTFQKSAPDDGQPRPQNDGAANTHVIGHAGRLLALEEAHLPIEMALPALDTRGATDFGGAIAGPFTAHPNTDPRSGELLFFGYGTPEPLSAGMSWGTIAADGRVTRFERFEAPYAAMVHDFAVTERHVLFPVMPITASRARAQQGRPPFAWEPEFGARVGLMPRGGSARDIVWWRGPACYVFHVMNAWEADGCVLADVMQFDTPPLFPRPDGTMPEATDTAAYLVRWTFDLGHPAREFTQQRLDSRPGEFPRIDERFAGQPYRHGWYVLRDEATQRGFAGLTHVDHATGQRSSWMPPAPDTVSEGVFVPRSPDAAQGEGWLLATVWRGATDRSELAVFDAQALAQGPLCTAALPHRVPAGFHGNWFDAQHSVPGAGMHPQA